MAKKKKEWVLKAAVFSALRRAWGYSPLKKQALDKVREEYSEKCKNGNYRKRVRFECEHCGKKFPQKGVQVDHIEPVVELSGFVDFNTYIDRLFCHPDKLQVLCKKCHAVKTAAEGKVRTKLRKQAKAKEPKKTKPKEAKRKKRKSRS
jgi:5-methylcytosine-specific restriction endonuclease McrA